MLFVDTSALARAYLTDEPESESLRERLLYSDEPVAASEVVRVELARSAKGAERAGRLADAGPLLKRIDADLGRRVAVLDLRPETVLPEARELVLGHRLGTLDAIHLAVALDEARRADEPITFVTRDADQAAAARALGFELA